MDYEQIKKAAESYRADMTRFLRAMISHPSESCEEKEVVACIKAEMEKLGYDAVEVDGLGNVIGWMGEGDKIIAFDSHIDTVGIGNINNWEADPYQGYEDDAVIFGRGGSDQEGGMAAATYGAKIMKDLGLIPAGYKIMVVGSVQEEELSGLHGRGRRVRRAGSTSSTSSSPPRASARSRWSSWCPPSPLTAASTGATGAAWRSAWT